eukprot:2127317-Pleurochrysis_carterae.AAC.1
MARLAKTASRAVRCQFSQGKQEGCTVQDGCSSSSTLYHVSSRLQNPEVNPITGPGRTAAM